MTEPPPRDRNAPAHWLGVGRLRPSWIADRSCYPQRSRSLVYVAVPAIGDRQTRALRTAGDRISNPGTAPPRPAPSLTDTAKRG